MLASFVKRSGGPQLSTQIKQKGLDEAIEDAAIWFSDRNCLFLIDDIWKSAGIPEDILGRLSQLANCGTLSASSSRVVYSTRDRKISEAVGGSVVEFSRREARGAESQNILLHVAEERVSIVSDDSVKDYIRTILDVCGGLPFTLNIAGRLVNRMKREKGLNDHCTAWKKCADMLQKSERLLNKNGESYFVSVLASLEFLNENRRSNGPSYEKFIESFCVTRRQDWVPLSVCKHMWGAADDSTTEEIADNLVDFGIVDATFNQGTELRGVQFHDHIHQYATWLAEKHGGDQACYAKLLDSYESSLESLEPGVCWPSLLEDDGYIIQNVCRFMLQCKRLDMLASTLCSGQWVTKMMFLGEPMQFDLDISQFKAAISSVPPQTEEKESNVLIDNSWLKTNTRMLSMLSKIVQMSQPGCIGHLEAAWFQLYARLQSVEKKEDWVLSIMKEAEKLAPRPFLRATSRFLQPPPGPLVQMHSLSHYIGDVKYLTDGRIASCGYSNEANLVKLYVSFLENNRPFRHIFMRTENLQAGDEAVFSLCISSNGKDLISGHRDGSVRVWNVQTMELSQELLHGHSDVVLAVDISRDGRRIASGSGDKNVLIWDARSGQVIGGPLGHADRVLSVKLNSDGRRVASGSRDKKVRVWDLDTFELIGTPLEGHKGAVLSVSMNADGRRVVSGSSDETAIVWDVERGGAVGPPLQGHTYWVSAVTMTRDGSCVASGSEDKTVRFWDVESGTALKVLPAHTSGVERVSFSDDGSYIVSSSMNKTVILWDVESENVALEPLGGHQDWVRSMSASKDGRLVASASSDTNVRVWDVMSGKEVVELLEGHTDAVVSVTISADGQRLAAWDHGGSVKLWYVNSGECSRTLRTGEKKKQIKQMCIT